MTLHGRWMRYSLLAGLLVLATLAYSGSELRDAGLPDALLVAPGSTSVQFKRLGPFHQVYYEVKTSYPPKRYWIGCATNKSGGGGSHSKMIF
jgi:hypothetical protein